MQTEFQPGELVVCKKTGQIGQIIERLDYINSDLYRYNSYEINFNGKLAAKLGTELEKVVDFSQTLDENRTRNEN